MSSGGKKKKRGGNVLTNTLDNTVGGALNALGNMSGGSLGKLQSKTGTDMSTSLKTAATNFKSQVAAAEKDKQMKDAMDLERKTAQKRLDDELSLEERNTARMRQRARARGAQGRRSTILTAGLLGESPRARKTLLGQ